MSEQIRTITVCQLEVEVVGKITASRHTTNFGTNCLSMTAVCWATIVSLYHRKDERKHFSCNTMVILQIRE